MFRTCSHMARVGGGPGSHTPRRWVRNENVHFLPNRSARTHRFSPVIGSASTHLISMRRNPLDELAQVGRRRHFPAQSLAGGWMVEAEQFGVQGQARRAAIVRDLRAVPSDVIHGVAANRKALFGKVNANLMRPPRFQPAGDATELAE